MKACRELQLCLSAHERICTIGEPPKRTGEAIALLFGAQALDLMGGGGMAERAAAGGERRSDDLTRPRLQAPSGSREMSRLHVALA